LPRGKVKTFSIYIYTH